MSIVQTVLVFAGVPALIIAVVAVLVYGKSMIRQPNRYRPGRAWDYPPSWFRAHPDALLHTPAAPDGLHTTATGGASGEW
jgi:hypothetical protein